MGLCGLRARHHPPRALGCGLPSREESGRDDSLLCTPPPGPEGRPRWPPPHLLRAGRHPLRRKGLS
eukprot:14365371-Heterocapsa_arctica.AAC.1